MKTEHSNEKQNPEAPATIRVDEIQSYHIVAAVMPDGEPVALLVRLDDGPIPQKFGFVSTRLPGSAPMFVRESIKRSCAKLSLAMPKEVLLVFDSHRDFVRYAENPKRPVFWRRITMPEAPASAQVIRTVEVDKIGKDEMVTAISENGRATSVLMEVTKKKNISSLAYGFVSVSDPEAFPVCKSVTRRGAIRCRIEKASSGENGDVLVFSTPAEFVKWSEAVEAEKHKFARKAVLGEQVPERDEEQPCKVPEHKLTWLNRCGVVITTEGNREVVRVLQPLDKTKTGEAPYWGFITVGGKHGEKDKWVRAFRDTSILACLESGEDVRGFDTVAAYTRWLTGTEMEAH